MKLLFSLFIIVFFCQVLDAQIIQEYDLEKHAEHAEAKGYDPNYPCKLF